MRISVVIPCFNAARWIADALRSVEEQTYAAHEIIVVDDGSTDDSVQVVESHPAGIRLLRTDRVNAAGARNAGIEAATGDWIAFLDADDRWYPNHLQQAANLLGHGTDVAYFSLMDLPDEDGQFIEARNFWPVLEPTSGLTHQQCIDFWQIKRNFHSLITIVASRQRLLEIGGFDRTQLKAHDVEMWLRLIHGRTWSYNPLATAVHNTGRPGGITESGRAASQYFVMRGFIKNEDLYQDAPGFDRILQRTARETFSAALLFGNRDDQRRIQAIAWPYLKLRDRWTIGTLGIMPPMYRWMHRLRMTLYPPQRLRALRREPHDDVAGADEEAPPESQQLFDATVVIVTKNRKEELRRAVESALNQQGRVEVLVIDDGSTDGTAELVREEFPTARLERVEESRGYIAHRNRAAELAASPILVSIDDDAAFSTPHTVEETLAEFDDPRVGAVAIPSIDLNRPGQPLYRPAPPDPQSIWVADTYRGTAHALRRDVFARLGGYREKFFHQGEEQEYALRLLNAGFVTRVGSASPIHHFESPRRNRSRIYTYTTRNNMLFSWYNVPLPHLLWHLPATVMNSFGWSLRRGHVRDTLYGTYLGCRAIVEEWGERAPVARSVYRLSRRLRKQGPARLETIEPLLPIPEPARMESCAGAAP